MVKAAGALGVIVKIRSHVLESGISPEQGGRDEGPNPHEMLEAALASCTILTCQLYANRKQWPLESTEATVQITAENKEGTKISRVLTFVGQLSEEQRQRLLEIADKCPIHNLLEGQVEIETSLK